MQEEILLQISSKIKEIRKSKNITVQELATKASVSKGLISQIENNRTIPSLTVLLDIIRSLNLDLNDFFQDILLHSKEEKVIIRKAKDYQEVEKENAPGFIYKRILAQNVKNFPVDIMVLELKKGARRNKLLTTEAYEYKYIIKGKVAYQIDKKKYVLEEGDSLFFDGRLGHKPENIGSSNALILVVYFFIVAQA